MNLVFSLVESISDTWKTMGFWIFLLLTCNFLSLIPWTCGQEAYPCPPSEDISPCSCEYDAPSFISVDCTFANTSQIISAFNGVAWFPNLTNFYVWYNDWVTELPEGVFGTVTFERIQLNGVRNLNSVHPSVILESKDRLQQLLICDCLLDHFQWDILSQLTELKFFGLCDSDVTDLPVFDSLILEGLYLPGNRISTFEAGWSTPNIKYLDMGA
ncbi:unnamed protein product [Darwinula stevensoni]|uniref:Uncharacterized protein n=1 Tax=Darwinula stevensoni TaxID=69355 RepID=A0A7R9AFD0_9CRUS|nr:unnamed protein product [Darwinula stevensoni]CAG0902950.1 unnamed protein product [Darwinula stevensoni]